MINVSFGPNIFLGIIVSVGVLILYSLRNVKPEIARDEDIFSPQWVFFTVLF